MGGSRARRRKSLRFAASMMLTLALTLVGAGVAQYALMARALTERALQQTAVSSSADAMVLRELHDAPDGGLPAVRELLDHIAARPGVHRVSLLAPDATVVAVGQPRHRSTGHDAAGGTATDGATEGADPPGVVGERAGPDTAARVREVSVRERRTAELLGQDTVVRVPVRLDGSTHVLEVVKSAQDLQLQVADLRRVTLTTTTLVLLLAVPAFYLLGGRRLSTRHGQALETSSTDGLTGLGNHRTFHEDLRERLDAATRQCRPLALALVDLDGFKQVNDTHGHRRGDRVLTAVAFVLREVTASSDGGAAYRIGGDEFALLLPAATDDVLALAERVRRAVEDDVDGVTTSIGVATLTASAPDAESLLEHADAALYASKRLGRNRVTHAGTLHGGRPPA
ncbi:diguanylate cyclase (GGDEF)-like protein [Kineococcus xinjiangensis]|uniref:Diguanylate cyclase (GGDEF)-like protein n=1 Tax=Kineococcus xinjiangensis TaxID=512762 RepID=A0A2S6IKA6_9ACTN|nr:GGDEF domain-containing protein [Kineococcus xinjiangensis]PPK94672.1 diguanylate cyclase (GGDEF)-like protein [Kineococcus xinjiangensis]